MTKNKIVFSVLVIWMLSAVSALGHDSRMSVTDIFFNERSGFIEVSHRLVLHDAEHVMTKDTRPDLVSNPEDRKLLERYISESFSLGFDGDDELISLRLLGSEIEGGCLWVYMDAPLRTQSGSLHIRNTIFQDKWIDQVNTVNIRRGKTLRTAVFSGETHSVSVNLF